MLFRCFIKFNNFVFFKKKTIIIYLYYKKQFIKSSINLILQCLFETDNPSKKHVKTNNKIYFSMNLILNDEMKKKIKKFQAKKKNTHIRFGG